MASTFSSGFQDITVYNRAVSILVGSFETDGYGEIVEATLDPGVASCLHISSGAYQMTLLDSWVSLPFASFEVFSSSALAGTMKLGDYNVSGTDGDVDAQTINMNFEQSGSGTNLASAGFKFMLWLTKA